MCCCVPPGVWYKFGKFPLTFPQEEESLVLLEEDCEALDAALEFENICIQERQKRINTNSSSNQSPNTEPDQLTAVIRKIRTLSATEASELLIKYFNKVSCSLWTHIRIEETCGPTTHRLHLCVCIYIVQRNRFHHESVFPRIHPSRLFVFVRHCRICTCAVTSWNS